LRLNVERRLNILRRHRGRCSHRRCRNDIDNPILRRHVRLLGDSKLQSRPGLALTVSRVRCHGRGEVFNLRGDSSRLAGGKQLTGRTVIGSWRRSPTHFEDALDHHVPHFGGPVWCIEVAYPDIACMGASHTVGSDLLRITPHDEGDDRD
jgi:hypothetical protein